MSQSHNKKLWSLEEDQVLKKAYEMIPGNKWALIAKKYQEIFFDRYLLKSVRTGKQCRERWNNKLHPVVQETSEIWSEQEIHAMIEIYRQIGPKWASMVSKLQQAGFCYRSDNNIKNTFHMRAKKALKQLNTFIQKHNSQTKASPAFIKNKKKYRYDKAYSIQKMIKKGKLHPPSIPQYPSQQNAPQHPNQLHDYIQFQKNLFQEQEKQPFQENMRMMQNVISQKNESMENVSNERENQQNVPVLLKIIQKKNLDKLLLWFHDKKDKKIQVVKKVENQVIQAVRNNFLDYLSYPERFTNEQVKELIQEIHGYSKCCKKINKRVLERINRQKVALTKADVQKAATKLQDKIAAQFPQLTQQIQAHKEQIYRRLLQATEKVLIMQKSIQGRIDNKQYNLLKQDENQIISLILDDFGFFDRKEVVRGEENKIFCEVDGMEKQKPMTLKQELINIRKSRRSWRDKHRQSKKKKRIRRINRKSASKQTVNTFGLKKNISGQNARPLLGNFPPTFSNLPNTQNIPFAFGDQANHFKMLNMEHQNYSFFSSIPQIAQANISETNQLQQPFGLFPMKFPDQSQRILFKKGSQDFLRSSLKYQSVQKVQNHDSVSSFGKEKSSEKLKNSGFILYQKTPQNPLDVLETNSIKDKAQIFERMFKIPVKRPFEQNHIEQEEKSQGSRKSIRPRSIILKQSENNQEGTLSKLKRQFPSIWIKSLQMGQTSEKPDNQKRKNMVNMNPSVRSENENNNFQNMQNENPFQTIKDPVKLLTTSQDFARASNSLFNKGSSTNFRTVDKNRSIFNSCEFLARSNEITLPPRVYFPEKKQDKKQNENTNNFFNSSFLQNIRSIEQSTNQRNETMVLDFSSNPKPLFQQFNVSSPLGDSKNLPSANHFSSQAFVDFEVPQKLIDTAKNTSFPIKNYNDYSINYQHINSMDYSKMFQVDRKFLFNSARLSQIQMFNSQSRNESNKSRSRQYDQNQNMFKSQKIQSLHESGLFLNRSRHLSSSCIYSNHEEKSLGSNHHIEKSKAQSIHRNVLVNTENIDKTKRAG